MSGHDQPRPGDLDEAAFERELGRAARSLAVEPLEPRILEVAHATPAPAARRADRALPLAALAVAVALAIVVGPRLLPTTGPGGASGLRSTTVVSTELRGSGWTCSPVQSPSPSAGHTPSASQAPAVRLVCQAPSTAHPLVAAMLFGEDAAGELTSVEIKSDILGTSNGTLAGRQIDLLYQSIALPFANSADAASARSWLRATLPLRGGSPAQTVVGGIPVRISVIPIGGYVIVIGEEPASF